MLQQYNLPADVEEAGNENNDASDTQRYDNDHQN